jgi:Mg/Co/Ni transporter MgtE
LPWPSSSPADRQRGQYRFASRHADHSSVGDRGIRLSEWLATVWKELGVGLRLGLTMAVASFLFGVFRGGLEVGLIVGISMLGIVLVTNLIGVLLPFA